MIAQFQAIASYVTLVHLVTVPSAPILNKVESRLSNCAWTFLGLHRGKLNISGSLFYISISLRNTEGHEAENSILNRLISTILGFYGLQKSLHIACRKDVQYFPLRDKNYLASHHSLKCCSFIPPKCLSL
jgi:hypothetical protein